MVPFFVNAQIFTDNAPMWGIVQYDWDGVYGSGVSTADWNMDGWDDLTFGNSSGALRTFINNQGNGFTSIHLPSIKPITIFVIFILHFAMFEQYHFSIHNGCYEQSNNNIL